MDLDFVTAETEHFKLKSGKCKVLSIYDGDTCTVSTFYPGMFLPIMHTVRLYGVDTPELHPPKDMQGREHHVMRARLARDTLRDLVLDKVCSFEIRGNDKYGRLLADLLLPDGSNVSEFLIRRGVAQEYFGGKKNDVTL